MTLVPQAARAAAGKVLFALGLQESDCRKQQLKRLCLYIHDVNLYSYRRGKAAVTFKRGSLQANWQHFLALGFRHRHPGGTAYRS